MACGGVVYTTVCDPFLDRLTSHQISTRISKPKPMMRASTAGSISPPSSSGAAVVSVASWGAVVVGSIDNFLRPLFMQGASMNTVVVFFSLIGGLQMFGLMGLIYGPLIFSIALVFFRMYENEFAEFLDAQDKA